MKKKKSIKREILEKFADVLVCLGFVPKKCKNCAKCKCRK